MQNRFAYGAALGLVVERFHGVLRGEDVLALKNAEAAAGITAPGTRVLAYLGDDVEMEMAPSDLFALAVPVRENFTSVRGAHLVLVMKGPVNTALGLLWGERMQDLQKVEVCADVESALRALDVSRDDLTEAQRALLDD